ncbi:MAG: VanW family protein [Christensenellales bacterium]|jgi:vancomycin resistance protein YoaR
MVVKKSDRANQKKLKITLFATLGVLIVALILCIVFLAVNEQVNNRIMNNTAALEGVTVGGIDISGMEYDEALEATADVPKELLSKVNITFTVEGETYTFDADQLGVTTDYEDVLKKALQYGNTGTLEERKEAINKAKKEGMPFEVSIKASREAIAAALLPLKDELDKPATDATVIFTPWGHLPDGTPYEQDQQEMIEAAARGKMWSRPDLVRIPDSEMPNKLRYKYWKNDKYVSDSIPVDANISRFVYKEGSKGRSVDMEYVVDMAYGQIQSGEYPVIEAPVTAVEPKATVESLKKATGLVTSWTSSYSKNDSFNRNWNVAKLSGIINGVVIQPGEEWSINKHAGRRTKEGGWMDAAGIVAGGYVDQPGGGVCQISSTLYNAAIRAALEIVKASHHSIPSNYIPFGLDATIDSNGPDLVLKNPYSSPIYIISYVDPMKKTATVEVYGPPVVTEEYGEVILDFSSKDGGTFGNPGMNYVYNATKAPNDKVLAPGESYTYAQPRVGRKVTTYIHYLSLTGEELAVKEFHSYTWNPRNGTTYVNGSDPATLPKPTPPPVPAPPENPPGESENPPETDLQDIVEELLDRVAG